MNSTNYHFIEVILVVFESVSAFLRVELETIMNPFTTDCTNRLANQSTLHPPMCANTNPAEILMAKSHTLPPHWLESPDVWSMADLCAVHDRVLHRRLHSLLQPFVDHLTCCKRCQAQGFLCELCHAGPILFPFGQVNTLVCPECCACFHRACLRYPLKPSTCPRCVRRRARQRKQQAPSAGSELLESQD